jgi:hypothetical protein
MHSILIITASFVYIILGVIHLIYTFCTKKFEPRNNGLISEMKNTSLVISKSASVWKAWIGFNASHSLGAIYVGLINIIIAISFPKENNALLLISILNIAISGGYLMIAKKYWFKIPFIGIFIATVLFILSALL